MYIEFEDQDAMARSMMIALANNRDLLDDPRGAINLLWAHYRWPEESGTSLSVSGTRTSKRRSLGLMSRPVENARRELRKGKLGLF